VFTEIFVTPPALLLSQKIWAVLNRKRAKGRDFYDIVFLLSFAKPDYGYVRQKIGVDNSDALRQKLVEALSSLDFKRLAADVRPFLFNPADAQKVERFLPFIKQTTL
jgi:hypothetical protein